METEGKTDLFKGRNGTSAVSAHGEGIVTPTHWTLRFVQIQTVISEEIGVLEDIVEKRVKGPINLLDLVV